MTHASFDFPADARGYFVGATAELYLDDWALRIGRMAPPLNPNSYPLDTRLWKYYGDQLEVEHGHTLLGQPGAVRFLAYRNYENIGRFSDAIAILQADPTKNAASCTGYNHGSGNFKAPDLCWVRRPQRKVGIGVNAEQSHRARVRGVPARDVLRREDRGRCVRFGGPGPLHRGGREGTDVGTPARCHGRRLRDDVDLACPTRRSCSSVWPRRTTGIDSISPSIRRSSSEGGAGSVGANTFTAPSADPASSPDAISHGRVGLDVRVLGDPDASFRLGLGAQLWFPGGKPGSLRSNYLSDGPPSNALGAYNAMARVLFAGDAGFLSYAAHVGIHLRQLDDSPTPGSPQGSEALFGAAAGARFAVCWGCAVRLVVGPEVFGETALRSFFETKSTALEGLLAGRVEGTRNDGPQLDESLAVRPFRGSSRTAIAEKLLQGHLPFFSL